MQNKLDQTLRFISFVSSGFFFILFGWYLERHNADGFVFWGYHAFYLTFTSGLLICFFFIARETKLSSRPNVITAVSYYLILYISFSAGSFLHQSDAVNINDKLNRSIGTFSHNSVIGKYLRSKKRAFEGRDSPITEMDYPPEIAMELTIAPDRLEEPIFGVVEGRPSFIASSAKDGGTQILPLYEIDSDRRMRAFFFLDESFVGYYEYGLGLESKPNEIARFSYSKTGNHKPEALWSKKTKSILHHWGDVFSGKIYVPGRFFRPPPKRARNIFEEHLLQNCDAEQIPHETIELFRLNDGKHIETIDLMEIFGRLKKLPFPGEKLACEDSLHANDVRVIKNQRHADFFPDGKIGDLLISFRNIDTILLVDSKDHTIKWHYTDFSRQHSPRITNHGTLLVFDNLASDKKYGRSRITEIDIANRGITGYWEGSEDYYFDSETLGRIQLIGNRIFIQESKQGRLFELDCPDKKLSNRCGVAIKLDVSKEVFILELIAKESHKPANNQ